MIFSKRLIVGLLSIGAVMASALPSMARPATIDIEANVRSGPSINASRIDGLPVGTPVEVLKIVEGSRSRWYYIQSIGEIQTEGWVDGDLIRFQPSKQSYGTLQGDRDDVINIRFAPSTRAKVSHTAVMGDLVVVKEYRTNREGDRWYFVAFPNQASGWVRGDLISVWPKGCIITCPAN